MLNTFIFRSFKNAVTKKLIKVLEQEKKYSTNKFRFNQDLYMFLRENQAFIKEKPMKNDITLEIFNWEYKTEIKIKAEIQSNNSKVKEYSKYFMFTISQDVNDLTFIFKCFSYENSLHIIRINVIPTKDKTSKIPTSIYKGPTSLKFSKDTLEVLYENFDEMGIESELLEKLIELSKDKRERLYIEWLDKIHNFLSD